MKVVQYFSSLHTKRHIAHNTLLPSSYIGHPKCHNPIHNKIDQGIENNMQLRSQALIEHQKDTKI